MGETEIVIRLPLDQIALIVIGAGISVGSGAPSQRDVIAWLSANLNQGRSNDRALHLARLLGVLKEGQAPRSMMASAFHLLQTAEPETEVGKLWEQFGINLLAGKCRSDGQPLWQLQPSDGHLWAAALANAGKALLVSLNYDGLTARALAIVTNAPAATPILTSREEIETFFSGDDCEGRSVPVIKLRGDIFHAVCGNDRCAEFGREIPMYELLKQPQGELNPQGAEKHEEAEGAREIEDASHLLSCPACGNTRRLTISFPGVFGKEERLDECLAAILRYASLRIGGIIFMGFSGAWDRVLVESLSDLARELRIPVYSLSKDRTPVLERAFSGKGANYKWVEFTSKPTGMSEPTLQKDILYLKCACSRVGVEVRRYEDRGICPKQVEDLIAIQHQHLEMDRFSFLGNSDEELRIHGTRSRFGAAGREYEITVEVAEQGDSFTGLTDVVRRIAEFDRLNLSSQLGIKSALLGERGPQRAQHNRYYHSLGVGLIGMIWYESLSCDGQLRGWAGTEEAKLALHLALLFHDAQHLPFSHMMEEIFDELNWRTPLHERGFGCSPYGSPVVPDDTDRHWLDLEKKLEGKCRSDKIKDFWKDMVIPLQIGRAGNPCLEAIVDSALDADKFEYVFHDQKATRRSVRLPPFSSWFADFLGGQSVTPEGLIRLEGTSPAAALALLEERMHLYKTVYLAPELRALECLARNIVLTWLKYVVPAGVSLEKGCRDYDLRQVKAKAAAKKIWELFKNAGGKAGEPQDLRAIKLMTDQLTSDDSGLYDDTTKIWLRECWNHLEPFASGGAPPDINAAARKVCPLPPIYVHKRHEDELRELVRAFRVDLALRAFVDIAPFPRFVAVPRHKRARMPADREGAFSMSGDVWYESFLVPEQVAPRNASPDSARRMRLFLVRVASGANTGGRPIRA